MGAAVAECGRSLSAWRRSVVGRPPDLVTRLGGKVQRFCEDALPAAAWFLTALFARSQVSLNDPRLHEGMSGTRVEAGRRRAKAAKRAVALAAASGFAVVLA